MCSLKQEEFLKIRFKENEVEREGWAKFKKEHPYAGMSDVTNNSQLLMDMADTFLEIAEKKRDIYKEHLDIEVENQKVEYESDEILDKLNEAERKWRNGEITLNAYWYEIDPILGTNPKDRKYTRIDGKWLRIS